MTEPLYVRDPDAWQASLREGNAIQARKRVCADALICDNRGRILLVNPSYKPDWDLPGGMAEANEPPVECVRRELREELGLDLSPARVLVVDWVPPHGPWDDMIAFIFDAGVLPREPVLLDGELNGFEFCDEMEIAGRLSPRLRRRVLAALAARLTGRVAYLQDGRPV